MDSKISENNAVEKPKSRIIKPMTFPKNLRTQNAVPAKQDIKNQFSGAKEQNQKESDELVQLRKNYNALIVLKKGDRNKWSIEKKELDDKLGELKKLALKEKEEKNILETQLEESRSILEDVIIQKESAEEKYENLVKGFNELKEENSDQPGHTVTGSSKVINDLKVSLKKMTELKEDLETEAVLRTEIIMELENYNKEMKERLLKLEEDNMELKAEVDSAVDDRHFLESLGQKNLDLEEELARLKVTLDEQDELEEQRQLETYLRHENVSKLRAELESMVNLNNSLQASLVGLEEAKLQSLKECEDLRAQVMSLKSLTRQHSIERANFNQRLMDSRRFSLLPGTTIANVRIKSKNIESEINGMKLQYALMHLDLLQRFVPKSLPKIQIYTNFINIRVNLDHLCAKLNFVLISITKAQPENPMPKATQTKENICFQKRVIFLLNCWKAQVEQMTLYMDQCNMPKVEAISRDGMGILSHLPAIEFFLDLLRKDCFGEAHNLCSLEQAVSRFSQLSSTLGLHPTSVEAATPPPSRSHSRYMTSFVARVQCAADAIAAAMSWLDNLNIQSESGDSSLDWRVTLSSLISEVHRLAVKESRLVLRGDCTITLPNPILQSMEHIMNRLTCLLSSLILTSRRLSENETENCKYAWEFFITQLLPEFGNIKETLEIFAKIRDSFEEIISDFSNGVFDDNSQTLQKVRNGHICNTIEMCARTFSEQTAQFATARKLELEGEKIHLKDENRRLANLREEISHSQLQVDTLEAKVTQLRKEKADLQCRVVDSSENKENINSNSEIPKQSTPEESSDRNIETSDDKCLRKTSVQYEEATIALKGALRFSQKKVWKLNAEISKLRLPQLRPLPFFPASPTKIIRSNTKEDLYKQLSTLRIVDLMDQSPSRPPHNEMILNIKRLKKRLTEKYQELEVKAIGMGLTVTSGDIFSAD